jgi:hypothetical protein
VPSGAGPLDAAAANGKVFNVEEIFWVSPDINFDQRLSYTSNMAMRNEVCARGRDHARRQGWPRPLGLIAPIYPLTDFECTVYNDMLVSPEIANGLKAEGFSGLYFSVARLHTTTETPLSRDALELRVSGWGGVAPRKSGVQVTSECPVCKWRVYSDYTDPNELFSVDEWDGSDFFIIWPMPRFIMVTRSVRNYLLKARYSGIKLRTLRELRAGPGGTITPGHLGDWFDEEKIKEIRRLSPHAI